MLTVRCLHSLTGEKKFSGNRPSPERLPYCRLLFTVYSYMSSLAPTRAAVAKMIVAEVRRASGSDQGKPIAVYHSGFTP
jgi:hypothetical protein